MNGDSSLWSPPRQCSKWQGLDSLVDELVETLHIGLDPCAALMKALDPGGNLGLRISNVELQRLWIQEKAVLCPLRPLCFAACDVLARFHDMQGDHKLLRRLSQPSFRTMDYEPSGLEAAALTTLIFMDTARRMSYDVDEVALCFMVVSVQSCYMDVAYHSYGHALEVLVTLHQLLFTCELSQQLEPQEGLLLLLAGLVHDIGHTGHDREYHWRHRTPMAVFMETLGMQHWGFEVLHVMCALDAVIPWNVLPDTDESKETLVSLIIGSDLQRYPATRSTAKQVLGRAAFDRSQAEQRKLLLLLLLQVANVGHVSKPWAIHEEWSQAIVEERLLQGEADFLPEDGTHGHGWMDCGVMAAVQAPFIHQHCLPLLQTIVRWFPGMAYMLEACLFNLEQWKEYGLEPASPSADSR